LPVKDGEELKQTNEIGMFVPLLDAIDIQGKDITADALLTQRKPAAYLVGRQAHYHFTVKGNQPTRQPDVVGKLLSAAGQSGCHSQEEWRGAHIGCSNGGRSCGADGCQAGDRARD
jgi:hypothetical protein